jgi:hypothetical protein
MMIVIDRRRSQIVDLTSYEEIQGAIAVDLDAKEVTIRTLDYKGERHAVQHFPEGIKILNRH